MRRLLFLGRNSLHSKGGKNHKNRGFYLKNYDQNHVILEWKYEF